MGKLGKLTKIRSHRLDDICTCWIRVLKTLVGIGAFGAIRLGSLRGFGSLGFGRLGQVKFSLDTIGPQSNASLYDRFWLSNL